MPYVRVLWSCRLPNGNSLSTYWNHQSMTSQKELLWTDNVKLLRKTVLRLRPGNHSIYSISSKCIWYWLALNILVWSLMRFGLGRNCLAESDRNDLPAATRRDDTSEKTASHRQEHQKEAALPPPPLRDPPRQVTCGSSSSGVTDLPGFSALGLPREHSLGLPVPERPETFQPRTRQPAPARESRDANIQVPEQRQCHPHPDMDLACCHAAQCGRYRNTCNDANGISYHSCCRMCCNGKRIKERDCNGAIHWRCHTRECDARQIGHLFHELGLGTLLEQRLQETKRLAKLAEQSNSGRH